MNNDLISREALKKALHNFFDGKVIDEPAYILRDVFCQIDGVPTVEAETLEHHNKIKGIMDNEIKSLVDILDNERPQGDLISREALKEDFKSRLVLCNEWIAKAKDKETKIRASAVKAYLVEVIMTINNAPTVELTELCKGCQYLKDCETCDKTERPQGEWIYNDYGNGCGNWHCSVCDHIPYYATKYIRFLIFCPNCGADMRGGGEP